MEIRGKALKTCPVLLFFLFVAMLVQPASSDDLGDIDTSNDPSLNLEIKLSAGKGNVRILSTNKEIEKDEMDMQEDITFSFFGITFLQRWIATYEIPKETCKNTHSGHISVEDGKLISVSPGGEIFNSAKEADLIIPQDMCKISVMFR